MHQSTSIGSTIANLIDDSFSMLLWCNWEAKVAWVHSTLDTIRVYLHELNVRISLWVFLIPFFVRDFSSSWECLVVSFLSWVESGTIRFLTQGAWIINDKALFSLSFFLPLACKDMGQNSLGCDVNWEWIENLLEDYLMESSPSTHTNIVDNNTNIKSLGSCNNQFFELLGIIWWFQVCKVVLND